MRERLLLEIACPQFSESGPLSRARCDINIYSSLAVAPTSPLILNGHTAEVTSHVRVFHMVSQTIILHSGRHHSIGDWGGKTINVRNSAQTIAGTSGGARRFAQALSCSDFRDEVGVVLGGHRGGLQRLHGQNNRQLIFAIVASCARRARYSHRWLWSLPQHWTLG
jgi:hypothetical protein